MWSGVQPISYSRLMIFDKKMSVREVRLLIFKFFRPIIKTPDIPSISAERRKHMNPEVLLEEEYRWFFENSQYSSGYDSSGPLYSIYINNNLPVESGYI
jgi:hypothetical protein